MFPCEPPVTRGVVHKTTVSPEHPTHGCVGTPVVWMLSRPNDDFRIPATFSGSWPKDRSEYPNCTRSYRVKKLAAWASDRWFWTGQTRLRDGTSRNSNHKAADRSVELCTAPCENWLGSRRSRPVGKFRLVYSLSSDGPKFKRPVSTGPVFRGNNSFYTDFSRHGLPDSRLWLVIDYLTLITLSNWIS